MLPTHSRRDFLRTGSAVLAGVALHQTPGLLMAADTNKDTKPTPIPIVDTHQHLWDLEKLQLPWLENGGPKELNRNYLMADYLKATAGQNVVKTVYMEVNVAPSQQEKEAEYVLDLCQQ
ncbi:MAG: amidohydrolase, partial [Planctomycetaceae bacterium]|nr:amidohydrolase [Planctomycetaceae bacterium]